MVIEIPAHSSGKATENEKKTTSSTVTASSGYSIRLKYVEPVLFLTVLGNSIFGGISVNVVEIQYCKAVLNVESLDLCLNATAAHYTNMIKYMSTYSMCQLIGVAIFPAIAAVFLGPWSDTFGRRPLLLSGSFGYFLTFSLWAWGSGTNLSPIVFLLFDLPLVMSGSGIILQLAVFAYVCDVTTPHERAFRMSWSIGLLYLGSLFGTLICPYLQDISYTITLVVSASVSFLAFIYVLIFLEESVSTAEIQQKPTCKNPFQWAHLKSIYKTCYTQQSSRTLRILLYVACLSSVSAVQLYGEGTVFYLFLQKALNWTVKDYAHLVSVCVIVPAFAAFLITNRSLGLSDVEMLSLLICARLTSAILFVFGEQTWLIYVSASLGSAGGIFVTVIRSFLSKTVSPEDTGKVFALLALLEALAPLAGSPVYSMIFTETLEVYPRTIFVVSAHLCFLMALTMISALGFLKISVIMLSSCRITFLNFWVGDNFPLQTSFE